MKDINKIDENNSGKFNVIIFDSNSKNFKSFDIIPYLIKEFLEEEIHAFKTFNDYKDFIIKTSRYKFWSKCEYEIILSDWPKNGSELKIDVYNQIMLNINVVTKIFIEEVFKSILNDNKL